MTPFFCVNSGRVGPQALGKEADVRLKVAPLLPHGWLNMYFTGDPSSMAASAEASLPQKKNRNHKK
jgi:hypothetical protein